ncbi:MAG: molybdopterin-dependent oxidoreductase, partial [Deltaproteobacteria bacterium]|nr:molybdopterin-dependent oxidoreductase [Deltaproteobacteria bacterium]
GKFYHGDVMERAIILVVALCGHLGRKGAAYSAFASIAPDTSLGAFQRLGSQIMLNVASADPRYSQWREQGYTDEMILSEYVRESFAQKSMVPSSLIYLVHGGILKELDRHNNWDPLLRPPLHEFVEESNRRGWYHLPDPDRPPRLVFVHGGNLFRRVRSSHRLLENFLPKIELLVTLDIRMSTTALYSDFVLPAASYYETDSIPWLAVPLAPYLNISRKAAEPLYESKSEWEIYCRLAQRLEQKAQERGIATYRDRQGRERRFDRVVEQLTSGGLYDFDDDEAIARDAFLHTENVEKLDWEVFKERGIAEFTGPGRHIRSISNACDISLGEPVVPLTWHTDRKEPYPTLTRRIQFYIDHDWYLELGEALPVHKDSPPAGGDYPLHLSGGHARWSIHSNWVDNALMLQLQRGEPAAFLNPQDAARRGIRDGDRVEVYNDVGRFEIRALLSSAVRPGEAIIYHSWDNFQFSGWRHFKNVMPSPVNPLEFAGGYFQLRPLALTLAPGMSDRDTRVEIRPLGA